MWERGSTIQARNQSKITYPGLLNDVGWLAHPVEKLVFRHGNEDVPWVERRTARLHETGLDVTSSCKHDSHHSNKWKLTISRELASSALRTHIHTDTHTQHVVCIPAAHYCAYALWKVKRCACLQEWWTIKPAPAQTRASVHKHAKY